MKKLSLEKTIFGVVLLSLLIGFVFWFAGMFDFRSDSAPVFKELVFDESQTAEINLGEHLEYGEGYIIIRAVYCGYGTDNEYIIVQTDEVSNPQKIGTGSIVIISGEEFEVLETNCEGEYAVLKKL